MTARLRITAVGIVLNAADALFDLFGWGFMG